MKEWRFVLEGVTLKHDVELKKWILHNADPLNESSWVSKFSVLQCCNAFAQNMTKRRIMCISAGSQCELWQKQASDKQSIKYGRWMKIWCCSREKSQTQMFNGAAPEPVWNIWPCMCRHHSCLSRSAWLKEAYKNRQERWSFHYCLNKHLHWFGKHLFRKSRWNMTRPAGGRPKSTQTPRCPGTQCSEANSAWHDHTCYSMMTLDEDQFGLI